MLRLLVLSVVVFVILCNNIIYNHSSVRSHNVYQVTFSMMMKRKNKQVFFCYRWLWCVSFTDRFRRGSLSQSYRTALSRAGNGFFTKLGTEESRLSLRRRNAREIQNTPNHTIGLKKTLGWRCSYITGRYIFIVFIKPELSWVELSLQLAE